MFEIFWIEEARTTMQRKWDLPPEGEPARAWRRSGERTTRTPLARLARRVGTLVPIVRRPAATSGEPAPC